VPNVTVWGAGAHLHATNPDDQTLGLRADGVRVYGFTLTAVTNGRGSKPQQARISLWREPGLFPLPMYGNVVRGNSITHGSSLEAQNSASSVGILVHRSRNFTIAENSVVRTLADGIHVTGGSRNGRVIGNTVRETGDDMIAVVSFLGNGWQDRLRGDPALRAAVEAGEVQVSDVLIQGNDVADQYWGRGMAVIGGRNITIRGNTIAGTTWAAGVIVAQEGGYATAGVRNVLVAENRISRVQTSAPTFLPAGDSFADTRSKVLSGRTTGQGAVEVHAVQNSVDDAFRPALAAAISVRDIRIVANELSDVRLDGIRIGRSTAPSLLQRISVVGNKLTRIGGSTIRNLLPDATSLHCSNNSTNGAADNTLCQLAHAPSVSGANVNCASLP
jgi:parallel beta-helix repeat protein